MLACRLATAMGLLSACSTTHSIEGDGSALDGSATDAPPIDASCPDADNDGARDARCGGDDCDDTDPHIGPHAGVCTGPTRVRECQGAMVSEHDCAAPTPDCDARIGQCAATACGDEVVHPDEQCDGPPPCLACSMCCRDESQCADVAGAHSCVPDPALPNRCGRCVAENVGGAAVGARCASDAECESAFCDPEQGRCTFACLMGGSACEPLTDAWCGHDENAFVGPGTESFGAIIGCHFPCRSDRDCPAASRCGFVDTTRRDRGEFLSATCRSSTGALPLGAACTVGLNQCATNNCINSVCTQTCETDADCASPLPHCAYPSGPDFAPPPGLPIPMVCST